MAEPPIWIHTVFGFLAAALSVLVTWIMSILLRHALGVRRQPGLPPAPHIVSICYNPGLDMTTIQYSNGEQFFVPGRPGSWGECPDASQTPTGPLCPSPGEALTTDGFRQLLDHPGDGATVAASKVQFNQEGGFHEN
jgi:hypothetical protein